MRHAKTEEQPKIKSFETFQPFSSFDEGRHTVKEPWCFNGRIGIRKYRITVEEIDEPKLVLIKRLRKLWGECDNSHHWQPLKSEAAKLGIELDFKDLPKRKPNFSVDE